jgi:hypothetical protein
VQTARFRPRGLLDLAYWYGSCRRTASCSAACSLASGAWPRPMHARPDVRKSLARRPGRHGRGAVTEPHAVRRLTGLGLAAEPPPGTSRPPRSQNSRPAPRSPSPQPAGARSACGPAGAPSPRPPAVARPPRPRYTLPPRQSAGRGAPGARRAQGGAPGKDALRRLVSQSLLAFRARVDPGGAGGAVSPWPPAAARAKTTTLVDEWRGGTIESPCRRLAGRRTPSAPGCKLACVLLLDVTNTEANQLDVTFNRRCQLAIPAPRPPAGSFDDGARARGKAVFDGKALCASCHGPPLFTEPGWNMHSGRSGHRRLSGQALAERAPSNGAAQGAVGATRTAASTTAGASPRSPTLSSTTTACRGSA